MSIASLIALASRWHWVAELFSHFRLHYLLVQGVLLIVFMNTRRYLWLLATVLMALPNAWYVVPYLSPLLAASVTEASAEAPPQIVTVNLNYRLRSPAQIIGYLQQSQAEVLVLSEYTPAWAELLEPALSAWPHRQTRPRADPFGLAVFSRQPFISVQELPLNTPGSENLHLVLPLAGREIDLYAVHLFPPTSPARAAARNEQLLALANALAENPDRPRLVTGDLNLSPYSPYFSSLLQASGLTDARKKQGLLITWPASPLPLWVAIDHCLADSAAGVSQVKTGPDIGSDHFPLEISLAAGS
ncbi:MAG: endonuclease/exonuclease/phosphatase family protein [Gammaproteobacteria bacterium]